MHHASDVVPTFRSASPTKNFSQRFGATGVVKIEPGLVTIAWTCAGPVGTVAHDRAIRGIVDHLAIEHPAVFEREVQLVAVFGRQPTLELDKARLAAPLTSTR